MAAGFPAKADYATGDVLTAANMNDLAGTVNLINPSAKGDLYAGSAANTYTKISVGANNTVLTADSSTATGLKWSTVASGGMTELTSGNLSTSASTLSLTSISGSYNSLILVLRDISVSTTNSSLQMRFNNDSSGLYVGQAGVTAPGVSANAISATQMSLCGNTIASATDQFIYIQIPDYANTSTYKVAFSKYIIQDGATPTWSVGQQVGVWRSTSAITEINLLNSTANNWAAGSYVLYGVK